MKAILQQTIGIGILAAVLFAGSLLGAPDARAAIDGLTGTTFNFSAKSGHLSSGDGDSHFFWGYGEQGKTVQYPGPTLIVTEGQTITINLTNSLPESTSLIIPGFDVQASGGIQGLLTREAPPDGQTQVSYSFVADRPGTFSYYSGSNADLQVEMGLFGALIVRPANFDAAAPTAYGDARSAYDQEYLFLFSEIDPKIHHEVEKHGPSRVSTTEFWPVLWFINGRNAPDTLSSPFVPWLPTQPYNCLPIMGIGDRVLMRFIGGGRDGHPFHTHGNNYDQIARDGYLLESAPGAFRVAEVGIVPDLAESNNTLNAFPGATYDTIFTWTGAKLDWDIYGHDGTEAGICVVGVGGTIDAKGFDVNTREYCADHGKPLPVVLPNQQDLTFGAFYAGSPFIGTEGSLPPGEGGNNPWAAFAHPWHDHHEKEIVNNDIFIGGILTILFILAPTP